MLNKINIKSLKSINDIEINAKQLNLFTGTNSSGKSSTIQGILILSQNLENLCGLNGPLVSIGNYREARNYNISSNKIEITISDDEEYIGIILEENNEQYLVGKCDSNLANSMNYRNRHLHYLSSNRIGSQDIYAKNMSIYKGVGINGEYAIEFLCDHRDEPLEEGLVFYKENHTFLAQVNYWLNYIVGASIKPEEILGTDAVKASYGLIEGHFSRPKNVGSGISYLISIIIICLGSNDRDAIFIENPEIHLHPLSQSKVCEFLYFVSNSNRQIFVETHSDHIFNAVRAGIATGEMQKQNIAINFFKLGSDNCTRNYEIEIGKNGKIENPIPRLFDQFDVDLNKMLGV